MEKPPLDKVIEKLERLDPCQWTWHVWMYCDPEFTAKAGGIIFNISNRNDTGLFKDKRYHYLDISDWKGNTQFEYYGKNDGFEEEKISSFYKKLHESLKTHRTAEFSEMLDEFLSEQVNYKANMKKPELEKVIKKLEQLDIRQWNWCKRYYGLEFTTDANGLTFHLSVDQDRRMFGPVIYHKLIIKNGEGSIQIEYANSKKDNFEEKEISRFYNKIKGTVENEKDAEFTHMLDEFLSE